MSTVFAVKTGSGVSEVAVRVGIGNGKVGIDWINPLGKLLDNDTPVVPIDNSPQGVKTIGDIKQI